MTFVSTGDRILGITARHVAEKVLKHGSEGRSTQVGGAWLRPDRHIATSKELDLATFEISGDVLRASRHRSFAAPSWPPPAGKVGRLILIGGYPGRDIKRSSGNYDVVFTALLTKPQSAGERNIGAVLRINRKFCLTTPDSTLRANANLGGMSGGPVFELEEEYYADAVKATFRLVAIVYEYRRPILLAHQLTSLGADGRFLDE